MCCRCCSVTQRKLWVFGCGSFFLLGGLVLGILWPTLALRILHQQLALKPGSLSYDNWIELPIPMYIEVTLFNWTNPDKLKEPGYKPHFEEYGPLVYREGHKRVNLTWNSNHTVSFYQIREWHFEPDLSNGTLDTNITTANVIVATVAHMMKDASSPVKKVLNYLLNHKGGSLLWTKPAGQWIFEGFEDPLLRFLKKFNQTAFDIPFNTFGWLVDRNMSATYDGWFQMNTGTDDIHKLGIMTQWKGSNRTTTNPGDCGVVNGTTGELWPPGIDATKSVAIFATDVCRTVTVTPQSSMTRHGVTGTTWKADNRTLDNGQKYPENKCWCPEEGECPKYGNVDVSKCRWGAPVYFSFPHFYMADPSYVEAVSGIKPEKEKHEFSLTLEPSTGIPLDVTARLQINMKLSPISGITIYENLTKEVVMPMFWFNQRAELDEANASKARLAIALPTIGMAIGYSIAGIGGIVILVGIILCITKKWGGTHFDDQEPLSDQAQ